jgi:hypothetical protein
VKLTLLFFALIDFFVFDGQHEYHHILKCDKAIKHAQRLFKEEFSIFMDKYFPYIKQHHIMFII